MGARYSTTGQENAVGAAYTTVVRVTGGAGLRVRLYEIHMGCSTNPTVDVQNVWTAMRHTVAPTDTAVTPTALDQADPAAEAVGGENASAEGTVTAGSEAFETPLNQRATAIWKASDRGELIVPAVAAAGFGLRVKSSSYIGAAEGSLMHEE